MRRWGRAFAAVIVAGTLVTAAGGVWRAAPAAADAGLVVPKATSTVFTVRGDGSVHVDVTATVQNFDACAAGYVCYYDHTVVPVLAPAFAPASDVGAVTIEPRTRFYGDAVVRLGRLGTGQRRTVHLGYELGGGPRSNPFVRTNAAYVEFFAFGIGSPGQVDVAIDVPDAFDPSVSYATMTKTDDGRVTHFVAHAIADPETWTAAFSARDDARLVTRHVDVSGHAISVHAWPGDGQWADFVVAQLRRGIPAIEHDVRRPLPEHRLLDITETAAPYIFGYAGWYTASTNSIEIGDDLDATVVLHEVSHEWFNRDVFDDRWIDEGLAQEYSTLASRAIGHAAAGPTKVDVHGAGHVALVNWGSPKFRADESDAEERYGYNASFFVIDRVMRDIGPARMATLLASAARGDITYVGAGKPEHQGGAFSWRQLLDALDNAGHSKVADSMFSTYVLNSTERATLAPRAAARATYAKLLARAGDWSMPAVVRQAMHDWNFTRATEQMRYAAQVIDRRASIAALVGATNVPPVLEREYRTTDDLAKVVVDATGLREAAKAITSARHRVAAGRSVFERVGLIGKNPSAALAKAGQAFARGDARTAAARSDEATATIAGSSSAGQRRLGIVAAVVVGLVLLGVAWRASRRRRRRADAAPWPAAPVPVWTPPGADDVAGP